MLIYGVYEERRWDIVRVRTFSYWKTVKVWRKAGNLRRSQSVNEI
jgi:hypothetical protein